MSELRQIYQHGSRVLYLISNIFDYSKLSKKLKKFAILVLSTHRTNCKYHDVTEKLKVNENLQQMKDFKRAAMNQKKCGKI